MQCQLNGRRITPWMAADRPVLSSFEACANMRREPSIWSAFKSTILFPTRITSHTDVFLGYLPGYTKRLHFERKICAIAKTTENQCFISTVKIGDVVETRTSAPNATYNAIIAIWHE
jgi:hypothetical protein